MRVVVALGGNALLRRGQAANAATQRANAAAAATAIGEIAGSHAVIVTHGSGPQVGLLALQSESVSGIPPSPLDVLDAETEGMIGYLLEQELINVLGRRAVATLLTQVAVDRRDPAFGSPSKPIGPAYDGRAARRLAAERGWSMASDGELYRRVVASPEPLAIVELEAIAVLVAAGILVVCVGGGGMPVRADDVGRLHGVEAVIDKEQSAALLAPQLRANALLLLTDVPHVEVG